MSEDRFRAYLADCDESLRLHYRIRYAVYCERKGFENPVSSVARMERDQYDATASHFLLRDNLHGRWHAAIRLVRSEQGRLPAHGLGAIDDSSERRLAGSRWAEVSRLSALNAPSGGRIGTIGLLKASIAAVTGHAVEDGISHLVFLVTPGMARLVKALGIPLTACGPLVLHRGRRRAYVADLARAIATLDWLSDRVESGTAYRRYSVITPTPAMASGRLVGEMAPAI